MLLMFYVLCYLKIIIFFPFIYRNINNITSKWLPIKMATNQNGYQSKWLPHQITKQAERIPTIMLTNQTDPQFPQPTTEHPRLASYRALYSYLLLLGSETTTEEELLAHYNSSFVHIDLDGYSVSIPFDATIYNSLLTLLETQIKEF